jgi:hypothetical protein
MNSILERVYLVCTKVRELNLTPISFKKLVSQTRRQFKLANFDLAIKTKKEKSLDCTEFYVNAYYDADDDSIDETAIEVVVFHNFEDRKQFSNTQITDFLKEIFDAVVHEYKHKQQSMERNYRTYSDHARSNYSEYLSDPDEVDAYSFSIAIELLRTLGRQRSQIYLTRISILSKVRQGTKLVSPNLHAYLQHFGFNKLVKRLSKKVYKHLEIIDTRFIFV